MSRKTSLLSLLLVLAMLFTAFAAAEAPAEPETVSTPDSLNGVPLQQDLYKGVTIKIWGPWSPTTQPRAAVDFENHTGAKIVYEVIPFGDNENAGDYRQAVVNNMAAGAGPEVVHAATFALPVWAMKNLVKPWDEYVDFSKITELNMTNAVDTLFKWNDQHYAIADSTAPLWNSSALFYNKAAFEDAGLTDPYELFVKGEWKWDIFTDYCHKLTYDSGTGAIDHWGLTTWFPVEPFVASNGGDAVKVVDGKPTYSLNAPEVVFALNYAAEKMPAGPSLADVGPDYYFASGQAAMYYEGYWYASDARALLGENLGIVPFPLGPDFDALPSRDYGEWCWAYMLAASASDEQAKCAADYFRYLWAEKPALAVESEEDPYAVWGGEEAYREILTWAGNTAMDTSRNYGDLKDVLNSKIWWNLGSDTPANLTESIAQEAQAIIDDTMK